jgi:protein-disulfide isomerase
MSPKTHRRSFRASASVAPLAFAMFATCGPGCAPPSAPTQQSEVDAVRGPKINLGEQAQAPSKGASAETKPAIQEAPGVDVSKLSATQRTMFFQLLNTEPSACGKPHSLATSLKEDATCRDSMIVAQFMVDRLAGGATPGDVKEEVVGVMDVLRVREIPVEGRPVFGNARAPVTVVVFADFECPHCRAEAPVLRQAVQQFRGQARLIYKHFPLNMHPRAKRAAVATEAALAQGKFWEMHDQVFAHQDALEDEDLMRYAKEIGLDMAAFEAHYEASTGLAVVEADRKHGDALGFSGTPAVFINGREYTPALFGGTVEGWIDDALRR